MASWWKSASATNITRGLSNITGQLSTNLKDILTEASEETFDPTAELQRARDQNDDLEYRKQALLEEVKFEEEKKNKKEIFFNIRFVLVRVVEKTM